MITGNNEHILSPIRTIGAKVEVISTSTDSRSGANAVRLDGCAAGATLTAQVSGIDDYSGVEVAQYGKNLFNYTKYPFSNIYIAYQSGYNYESSGSWSGTNDYIPCSHLQGQTITLNHPPLEITSGTGAGIAFYTEQSISSYISGVNAYSFTIPVGANYFRFAIPRAYADGTQIQIELGDTVTEYEAYKAPVTATVDESGKAEFTAHITNTFIIATNEKMSLSVSYEIESAGNTISHTDNLKSIGLDRVGEKKFFGFGISQKATVEVLDKERTSTLKKGDKIKILFDDVRISPTLTIDEVKRDEKTNTLTVTALDAICASANHTYNELGISSYTLGELTSAIAKVLKVGIVIPSLEEFSISYPEGGNFEGSETLREVLNAIAEATQTVYFINYQNVLTFKRLDNTNPYTIDKSQYIELEAKEAVTLAKIVSATELGDNLEATTGTDGATQTIYNNPLLELREDLATLLETAISNVGGMSAVPFTCTWRGNYLVEPTDAVSIIARDGSALVSYLIGDTITYNGGYKQVSEWAFENENSANNNPTTLGEVIKQTYAKVDKANKEIEIVASEAADNKSAIATIRAETDSISASVIAVDKRVNESAEALNGSITELTSKVNATMTSEEIKLEIATELSNGVDKVVTEKGYTFDDEGLKVTSSGNSFTTTISENGMIVREGSKDMLIADNEGVTAVDLHAKTFLIIGDYSRLQNYPGEKRTACFWIGG